MRYKWIFIFVEKRVDDARALLRATRRNAKVLPGKKHSGRQSALGSAVQELSAERTFDHVDRQGPVETQAHENAGICVSPDANQPTEEFVARVQEEQADAMGQKRGAERLHGHHVFTFVHHRTSASQRCHVVVVVSETLLK